MSESTPTFSLVVELRENDETIEYVEIPLEVDTRPVLGFGEGPYGEYGYGGATDSE